MTKNFFAIMITLQLSQSIVFKYILYLGKGKENTAPNSTESGSGWQSKDTVKEMKEKFHHLTERAKQEARDGDLEECLRLYKQAYKIHKSEKVAKRIEKLKVQCHISCNFLDFQHLYNTH